jgi:hypothetical protein
VWGSVTRTSVCPMSTQANQQARDPKAPAVTDSKPRVGDAAPRVTRFSVLQGVLPIDPAHVPTEVVAGAA